jgi:hypothetical protein
MFLLLCQLLLCISLSPVEGYNAISKSDNPPIVACGKDIAIAEQYATALADYDALRTSGKIRAQGNFQEYYQKEDGSTTGAFFLRHGVRYFVPEDRLNIVEDTIAALARAYGVAFNPTSPNSTTSNFTTKEQPTGKVLIMGAHPDQKSIKEQRPALLENTQVYFLDAAANSKELRTYKIDFGDIEIFSKQHPKEFRAIVFDHSTFSFFKHVMFNYLAGMLMPDGAVYIIESLSSLIFFATSIEARHEELSKKLRRAIWNVRLWLKTLRSLKKTKQRLSS